MPDRGIVVALACLLAWAGAAAAAPPPSIVLILTDDEDLRAHAHMPRTKALIEDQGATAANFFATNALCAPSRVTLLRGQYPHNHRIQGNTLPTGGYAKLRELGLDTSTIATWLDEAGYRTAFVGKYVNGYQAPKDPPAPGWDHWFATENSFFNFAANRNGAVVRYGEAAADYLTDVLAAEAEGVIRGAAAAEPLFLHVTPFAPHSPAVPAPRHAHAGDAPPLPRPPSFGEADVSDKPALVRARPPLTAEREQALATRNARRIGTLQAVDELVERVVRALAETGRLASTFILYASDNGLHMGEHRIGFQKTTPYEESIRAPLLVRGPGVAKGSRVDALLTNTDLAPTLAAIAGVAPPSFVDGRSFLPLLRGARPPWRHAFLIERRMTEEQALTGAAVFDGLRTGTLTYVEYGNGERELYDLARDPYQLENRVGSADSGLLAALSTRLAELRNCAASQCRLIEDRGTAPIPPAAP